jgi:hypothetical protein
MLRNQYIVAVVIHAATMASIKYMPEEAKMISLLENSHIFPTFDYSFLSKTHRLFLERTAMNFFSVGEKFTNSSFFFRAMKARWIHSQSACDPLHFQSFCQFQFAIQFQ